MKKQQLKHLAPYLPYGLKGVLTEDKTSVFHDEIWFDDESIFYPGAIWQLCGYAEGDLNIPLGEGCFDGFLWRNNQTYVNFHTGIKPILRPLSDLIKEINYGLSTYAFTDLFEIGDCDGCIFEFDNGNIKTIELIESISKNSSYNDINYLPHAVVSMMIENNFDVLGLIEKGLAIDINTLIDDHATL